MKPTRTLCVLATLAAFAIPATANGSNGFPFYVDPGVSKVYVKITTTLGDVVLDANQLAVDGTLDLDLCEGGHPVSTGIVLPGTRCLIPTISGYIPNPIQLLPPICGVRITNLALALDSALFQVDALGNFATDVGCHVVGGTLALLLADTGLVNIDLVGTLSNLTPGVGAVALVGDRLQLDLDAPLQLLGIDVPLLNATVHIGLRLDIEAYFGYPQPIPYCHTSANSVGEGARISSSGTTSLYLDDLALHTEGLPVGQFGIYYFGPNKVEIPFGDGVRCVGGSVVRFAPLNSGPSGSVSMPFHAQELPQGTSFGAGDSTNVQFWYRDPASGVGHFNLSDALDLFFVP